MTWTGKLPPTVYAQAIGGSSAVDSTAITLTVAASIPATTTAPASSTTVSDTAHGTASGLEIFWNGVEVIQRPAGNVLIGQGVSLVEEYVGPPVTLGDVLWQIKGDQASKLKAGSPTPVGLGPDDMTQTLLHFYWVHGPAFGKSNDEQIECTLHTSGGTYDTTIDMKLFAPTPVVHNNIYFATDAALKGVPIKIIGNDYLAVGGVYLPSQFTAGSAKFYFTQTMQADIIAHNPGLDPDEVHHVNGLDTTNPYPFVLPYYATDEPSQTLMVDHPGYADTAKQFSYKGHFKDWIMFEPPGNDWIAVPLEQATWGVNLQFDKFSGAILGLVVDAPYKMDFKSTSQYPSWKDTVVLGTSAPYPPAPPTPHS